MQNVIASIILALTPGIYLGIVSLPILIWVILLIVKTQLGAGAGKTASTVVNSKVNVILYSIFTGKRSSRMWRGGCSCTVVSICAGPMINFFGPKLCMAFGTTGYAVCRIAFIPSEVESHGVDLRVGSLVHRCLQ